MLDPTTLFAAVKTKILAIGIYFRAATVSGQPPPQSCFPDSSTAARTAVAAMAGIPTQATVCTVR